MCCLFWRYALCKACHTEGGLRVACRADLSGFVGNVHSGAGLGLWLETLVWVTALLLAFLLLAQIYGYRCADSAQGCQIGAGTYRADAEADFAIQGGDECDADE